MRQHISFASGGERCAAWLYADATAQSGTCIIMAHGFGGTRHYGLDAYAQAFRAAGYDVLLFDYRHFGESGGEPRGLLKVGLQHEDWHAAIAHARSLGYGRIVLWGSSFAGGHVLAIAATRDDIAGVIAQVPHISGLATSLALPVSKLPRVAGAVLADAVLGLFGSRHMIRAFAPVGEFGAMSTPGAHDALIGMLPSPDWRSYFDEHNHVTALSLIEALLYSPGRHAARIGCPVLIQAGKRDQTTPFEPARKAAGQIPDCEFRAHDCDHFDVYLGASFDTVIAEQIDFLQRRIPENHA